MAQYHSEDEDGNTTYPPAPYPMYLSHQHVSQPSLSSLPPSPALLSSAFPLGGSYESTAQEFLSGPISVPTTFEGPLSIEDNINQLMLNYNVFPNHEDPNIYIQPPSNSASAPDLLQQTSFSLRVSPPPTITIEAPDTSTNIMNHGWGVGPHSPASPLHVYDYYSCPGSPHSSIGASDTSSMGHMSPSPYPPSSPLTPTSAFGEDPSFSYQGGDAQSSDNLNGFEHQQDDKFSEASQSALSLAEQKRLFQEMVYTAPIAQARGPFIPQIFYEPHNASDRRRYVDEAKLVMPIIFAMHSPDEYGIPLREALQSRFNRLVDRDETVFGEGHGPSISVRLMWPGYKHWSRQIPTKDFRSTPGPITKARLAINVARSVKRFIDERSKLATEEPIWRVGQGHITLDDLLLVSMHQNSKGSWQAHLRLAHPRPTTSHQQPRQGHGGPAYYAPVPMASSSRLPGAL